MHRLSGDPLIQRLEQIAVSIEEEEAIPLPDVLGKVKTALDVDKVTKKFYERFKAEHAAFLKFIKGIEAEADLRVVHLAHAQSLDVRVLHPEKRLS